MLRTTSVEAPRGKIYDRNGVLLATSKLGYDIYIYRTGLTSVELNHSILKISNILEKNNDKMVNNLPIEKGKVVIYNDTQKKELMRVLGISKEYSGEEYLQKLYLKYGLNTNEFSEGDKQKIVSIRYEIGRNGYSLFRGVNIATNISYKSMATIEELKSEIEGIEINITPKRYYPNETVLAHTLGYVSNINAAEYKKLKDQDYSNNSIIGKTGIELSMEKYLKGQNGILRKEIDSSGVASSEYIYKEAVSGSDIYLTIDYRLQVVAEKSLQKVIKNIQTGATGYKKYDKAASGAVVVINVNTGEVLAMASYPTYNPNAFVGGISYSEWDKISNNALKPMFNRVIAGTYSPGSTYKMLTAITGLETGKINTKTLIKDTGIYPYGHHPQCWLYTRTGKTHGTINVSEAIKVSCNVFFYEVGRRVGIDNLVKYSKMFGLGEKTGIELLGESKGMVAGENKKISWHIGDTLSAAIGQSYNSYTPLQLVNYIAALANGENLNKITLLKSVLNTDNKKTSQEEIEKHVEDVTKVKFIDSKLELKEENVAAIVKGMKSVTSDTGGTSYIVFKNSEIEVAGKTGTAQVSSGDPNGIFVGFAPIKNPEIAVVAIIEHGGLSSYSASVAKPILEEYFSISLENQENKINQSLSNQGIDY